MVHAAYFQYPARQEQTAQDSTVAQAAEVQAVTEHRPVPQADGHSGTNRTHCPTHHTALQHDGSCIGCEFGWPPASCDPANQRKDYRQEWSYRFGAISMAARLYLLTGHPIQKRELVRLVNKAFSDWPDLYPPIPTKAEAPK